MNPVDVLCESVERGHLPEGLWVVACSGGLDSIGLLQALVAGGYRHRLRVVTVDHGVHPESAAHCAFVLRLAQRLSVEAECITLDGDALLNAKNLESAARTARYAELVAYAERVGASAILTAHTADDQAETVLMRLAKGAGLRGLRGVLPLSGLLRRPWLEVERKEVRHWAQRMGIDWCEDPTNSDPRFMRNRLRQSVTPHLLTAFGESYPKNASRSAARLHHANRALDVLLKPFMTRCIEVVDGGFRVVLDVVRPLDLSVRLEVLYRALSDALDTRGTPGLNRQERQVLALNDLALRPDQGTGIDLGFGWRAWRSKNYVEVRAHAPDESPPSAVLVSQFGSYRFGLWTVRVSDGGRFMPASGQVGISLARQPFPWMIETLSPEHLFRPFGSPGHRKAARLLMDAGIPSIERIGCPVIHKDGRVLMIPEVRPGEVGRCGPGDPFATIIFERE